MLPNTSQRSGAEADMPEDATLPALTWYILSL